MPNEYARGLDELRVGVSSTLEESGHARTVWTIDRFDAEDVEWLARKMEVTPYFNFELADFKRHGVPSYKTTEFGNLLTTAGLNRLTSLLIGGGGQAMTNTATRIGVGNGTTAAAVGDTNLSGASKWFQIMSATYPQQSNGVVTLQAAFASGDGNFAWDEFGIDIGTPTVTSSATVAALLFNHKVAAGAQGTKAAGQVWTATATVTFS